MTSSTMISAVTSDRSPMRLKDLVFWLLRVQLLSWALGSNSLRGPSSPTSSTGLVSSRISGSRLDIVSSFMRCGQMLSTSRRGSSSGDDVVDHDIRGDVRQEPDEAEGLGVLVAPGVAAQLGLGVELAAGALLADEQHGLGQFQDKRQSIGHGDLLRSPGSLNRDPSLLLHLPHDRTRI